MNTAMPHITFPLSRWERVRERVMKNKDFFSHPYLLPGEKVYQKLLD
jgi:hypothetical protein